MDKIIRTFLYLLRCHLEQQDTRDGPNEITASDWEGICAYAGIHNVAGMIAQAVKYIPDGLKPEEHILKQLEKGSMKRIAVSVNQDIMMDQVMAKLNVAGMDHVLMKGFWLKRLYPVPELRTMGDVDILIRPDCRRQCHQLLLELGAVCTLNKGSVWCYEICGLLLEVHTNLMAGEPVAGVDFEDYFRVAPKYTLKYNRHTLIFTNEYHFIYLMAHAAKHFRGAGYGIRGIMDFAVYLRALGKTMDWNYIWHELDKLGLDRYALAVLSLCKAWFYIDTDQIITVYQAPKMTAFLEKPAYDQMTDIIFSGGVYGYYGQNMEKIAVRRQVSSVGRRSVRWAKVKTLWKMIFPGYRYMRLYMRKLDGHPYLLPAAWCIRWYEAVFKRGKRNIGRMKAFIEVDDKVNEEYELMKTLGLL